MPIGFYLWVNVYGLILISQFWSFTNSVSHPREAKRIFGIVGVGGILGGLFGGLVAPALARVGQRLVAAPRGRRVAGRRDRGGAIGRPRWRPEAASLPGPRSRKRRSHPSRHPYVRWLALAALCSVLVTTLVDYLFKVEIQRRYPSPDALASFLGLFYTATNLAALTIQVFATRWSLQRSAPAGRRRCFPPGSASARRSPRSRPGFGAVVATRLWDQVMRLSLNKTAVELFYFPLAPGLRRKAKALIEAGLERLGDALAGLLILAAGAAMGASVQALAAIGRAAGAGVGRGVAPRSARLRDRARAQPAPHEPRHGSATRVAARGEPAPGDGRLLESPYERVVLHGIEMSRRARPSSRRAPAAPAGPLPRRRCGRALCALAAVAPGIGAARVDSRR